MFDFDEIPAATRAELEDEALKEDLQSSVEWVSAGTLRAFVWRRPEHLPKPPIAVLMLPGNPTQGGYRCDHPLPKAVDEAFRKAGFPVVRFDFDGQGTNHPGTRQATQHYDPNMQDVNRMFDLAEKLGEQVCVVGWNYSGTIASQLLIPEHPWRRPQACAMISLSFAYKQWEFASKFVSKEVGEATKRDFEDHSRIEVPSLYVFGSADKHTPLEDVERIVQGRTDQGKKAQIHVVDQSEQKLSGPGYFIMQGREAEAADVCASWLQQLRSQVVAQPSLGAAAGA